MNNTTFFAAGILPYSYDKKNKLVFLLGREYDTLDKNKNKKLGTFCDFGGSREKSETAIQTAIREFDEESMGSIIDKKNIRQKDVVFSFNNNGYHQFLLKIKYSTQLPLIYNRIFKKLGRCMKYRYHSKKKKYINKIISCPIGLVEKRGLRWFTVEDIYKNKKIIRPEFYNTFKKMKKII